MTEYSTVSNPNPKPSANWGRLLRYVTLGAVANALIWSFAFLFLKEQKPIYTSSWTFTIPTGVRTTNVNLPGLGGTSEQQRNPFANDAFDFREIYKTIITSRPVMTAAETRLGTEVSKPRVEIIDNTTLMSASISADTPEDAAKQANALIEAFQARLNELRVQDTARQEQGIQSVLSSARKKLELSQKRLSDFKARTGFVDDNQITQLSGNIEELRKIRAQAVASQQQANARLAQLSSDLKLNPSQAGEAFVLKADPIFQRYLLNYSEANAALVVLNSKFGPNHPLVLRERSRQEAARAAVFSRSQAILNRPIDSTDLARLNIGEGPNGNALESLFQNLVVGQVDRQGLTAQAQELDRQIVQLETRLNTLSKQGATMDALMRDMQIAQTVFSSTLARLDVGKLDSYNSYPAVEVLESPSEPESPSAPNKKIVLLGATLASLFITSTLISAWTRKRWLPRLAGVGVGRTETVPLSDASLLPSSKPEVKSEMR